MKVLLTGLIVPIAVTGFAQDKIQARKADQFVDSMGINLHMESPNPPYKNYAVINAKLRELGMRRFRDEINDTDPSFVKEMKEIGGLGYRLCGLIEGGNDYPPHGTRLDARAVVAMIHDLQPTIEAVEGPNEPDDGGFVYDGVPYPKGAINESQDLWNIVKRSSEIRALPVLVMSEGKPQDYTQLVPANGNPPADYATYGNMHAYQASSVGDNLLVDTYMLYSRKLTGIDPLWTTEMGYHNYTTYLSNNEQQGVSQRASGFYLPIAFLSGFDRGVLRTFSYELIDEIDDPHFTHACVKSETGLQYCSGEGHYGLLNYDGSPKPAFTALKNLIELLREPEAKHFEPGSLTITFSDAPRTMRYVLLQKSSGAYFLALWNDKEVYKVATKNEPGSEKYPPHVPITLTFSAKKDLTIYAPNDASGVNPTDSYTIAKSGRSIKLRLPPKVLLIKIVEDKQ